MRTGFFRFFEGGEVGTHEFDIECHNKLFDRSPSMATDIGCGEEMEQSNRRHIRR
jgi:hypothetical protein